MKDGKFKQFIREQLEKDALEELELIQQDEKLRDVKMPEEMRQKIRERIHRRIEE